MEEKKKINFFKRIKKAVCNLEEYIFFATEKFSVGFKFFLKLLLIFVIIISIAFSYRFYKMKNNAVEYIKNELPNFEIKDNLLEIDTTEIISKEDKNGLYSIIINTVENEKDNLKLTNGIVFLKDKLIIKIPNIEEQEYSYESILKQLNTSTLTKQQILEYIENNDMIININFYLITVAYLFIVYGTLMLLDVVMLAILAFILARIARVKLSFSSTFNLAVCALTLPIILNCIYIIINILTGFEVKYFQTMYNIISYIYIAAAILMIKTDLIKQQILISKIVEEQKKQQEEEETQVEKKPKEKEPKEDKQQDKPKDEPEPEG